MRRLMVVAVLLLCLPMVGEGQSIRYHPDLSTLTLGKPTSASIRFHPAIASGSTLLTGLVSYWPLDEESGTRYDAVGGNDLTDNNTVGFDTGVDGAAASFVAANNESLSVSQSAPASYSVSLWINQTGLNNDGTRVGSAFCFKNGVGGVIQYAASNHLYGTHYATLGIYDGTGWYLAGNWSGGTGGSGEKGWTHMVATHDSATKTIRIYSDNVFRGEATYVGTAGDFGAADTAIIGKQGTNPYVIADGANWNPAIDEVAIWDRVLTSDERAELYNAGAGKFYPF